MKVWLSSGLVWVACVAAVGCSNQPQVAPVRGVVKLDGNPLPGGRIMFAPIASGENKIVGESAFGQIQQDGSFVLTTYKDGDGAVVGSHYPVVMENRQEDDPNSPHPTVPGPRIGVVTMQDTILEVVAGKENEFTIEMDSRADYMLDSIPEIDIDLQRQKNRPSQ